MPFRRPPQELRSPTGQVLRLRSFTLNGKHLALEVEPVATPVAAGRYELPGWGHFVATSVEAAPGPGRGPRLEGYEVGGPDSE